MRRMAAVPAEVLGLNDRGTLAVGKRADINVIDIDKVEERQPQRSVTSQAVHRDSLSAQPAIRRPYVMVR